MTNSEDIMTDALRNRMTIKQQDCHSTVPADRVGASVDALFEDNFAQKNELL